MVKIAKKYGHRYPWDAWFSRKVFALRRGRDFTGNAWGMVHTIRNTAWKRRLRTQINVVSEDLIEVQVVGTLPPLNGRKKEKK